MDPVSGGVANKSQHLKLAVPPLRACLRTSGPFGARYVVDPVSGGVANKSQHLRVCLIPPADHNDMASSAAEETTPLQNQADMSYRHHDVLEQSSSSGCELAEDMVMASGGAIASFDHLMDDLMMYSTRNWRARRSSAGGS